MLQSDSRVPKCFKLEAIAARHMLSGGDEEIRLIKQEMLSMISFYLSDGKYFSGRLNVAN